MDGEHHVYLLTISHDAASLKFARRDTTVPASFSRIVVEQQHAREHRARLLWVAPKLSRIDSNDFGFICAGINIVSNYKRNVARN